VQRPARGPRLEWTLPRRDLNGLGRLLARGSAAQDDPGLRREPPPARCRDHRSGGIPFSLSRPAAPIGRRVGNELPPRDNRRNLRRIRALYVVSSALYAV